MKNITNSESVRSINGGGGVTVGAVMGAMGLIYGAYEACSWAAKTGYSWGTAIGRKIFK